MRHHPRMIRMSLLQGLKVVQIGEGLAAAVCGRLFADVGASVHGTALDASTPLAAYLNHGKIIVAPHDTETADLIIVEGGPHHLREHHQDPASLRRMNPNAAIVAISPFGQVGPWA